MLAFVARLSGLRAVAERCGRLCGTRNFSSLAPALRRPSALLFVRALVERLCADHRPGREQLVAIDGMALTLPATLRHHCARSNRRTAGGGVIWAYALQARRGSCPVRPLRVVRGAWRDTAQMRGVALAPRGPVYLMDRGFYCFDLLSDWLEQQVHFIVRARQRSLVYTALATLSAPRRIGRLYLEQDAWVRLGGPNAKQHPALRLVAARLASGERLILVSDRWQWTAERILAAYRQRWQIETFHKLLKEAIGLAHLYSFSQTGLEFLLYTALLLALLLLLARPQPDGAETIDALRSALAAARAALGLGQPWKRNACILTRPKRKSAKLRQTFIR